ncbi:MAG: insulinase family protein [Kofleriaceae bacterium]|nr:insulinase family protein [Kofleriaceae bacterium]
MSRVMTRTPSSRPLRRSAAVRVLALATLLLACPGKGPASLTPTLPGDGTGNVAKPGPVPTPTAADPWTGRTDLVQPPAVAAPERVPLPAPVRFTLPSGLAVIVVENHRLPMTSMMLAIGAGRADEAPAKRGVAELAGNMLVKGSKKRDAQKLARAIEFVGGSLTVDTSHEATMIGCSVMSRELATCLSAVPEIVTQPVFPAGELDKMRGQMIAGLRARLDNAGALASVHLQNLLWGDEHVRGWVVEEQDLAALTPADLTSWHKAWFHPNNAVLVVAGDVDPKKLKADLTRAFAPWKKGAVPPHPKYGQPTLSGVRIRLVDKPGQTQTHIRVGQFGIAHDDPRFFSTLVWNYTLGGGAFSSRLMQVVRSQGGKTYGASSSFDRNRERGSFVAETFTRSAETVATVKLVLAELARMAKDGPTADEVSAAIANLAGGYALRFQSARDVASALLAAELHGFNETYVSDWALAVGAVRPAEAVAAAREILDPVNFVLVLVGDAKELEPQLKSAGWRYQKVAFTDPIGRRPQVEPPVDAKAEAAARALLDEALAAKGGFKRLSAIKSLSMIAAGEANERGQKVAVEIARTFVLPDKTRVDIKLPAVGVEINIAIDGKVGWQRGPDPATGNLAVADIPASELPTIEADRWREPELVLLRHREPGTKVRALPDDTRSGSPRAVIRLTSGDGARSVDLLIDRKSKLLAGMAYLSDRVATIDEFADYREVQGVKVAHKRTSSGGGRSTEYTLTKVTLDGAVDPAVFKRPTN